VRERACIPSRENPCSWQWENRMGNGMGGEGGESGTSGRRVGGRRQDARLQARERETVRVVCHEAERSGEGRGGDGGGGSRREERARGRERKIEGRRREGDDRGGNELRGRGRRYG